MPHLSSHSVDDETFKKIHKLLIECFSSEDVLPRTKKGLVNEIFTKTEKEMIGKRLAAVSLMSQGTSRYETSKQLKLSESTTNIIYNRLKKGFYKNTVNVCATARKGVLGKYFENLFKPLPRYGTSPASLLRKK